ncbi:putative methyltransferase-like protein 24 isoform X2 [Tubulanus polymorphus]|uniref:putative methyltransferase-like protein 24 isoform X2 n=1 Tax=Tubulanus polymorphus TaxID=672921 RepID=UPI003DA6B567
MNNKMPMLSRIIAGVAVVVIFIVIIIAYTLQGGYHSLSFTKKEPCQFEDLVESHQLLKTQLNQKSDTSNVEEGLEDIKQRLDAIKNSRGLTIPDDSMPDVYFKVVNKKLIPVTIAQILTENHCVKQSTTSNNNAQQPRAPAQKQQQQAPQADENEDEVDEDLDEEEPVKEISPPRHQPQPKQTLVIKQSDRRYQLVYPDTTVSLEQLDRMYQSKVTTIQVKCRDRQRFGSQGDGGWDVCMDSPFTLKKPCLVYSFGINWDFQFDDAVDRRAQCEVHCFDPSMNSGDFRRSNNVMFYNLGISGRNGRMNGWNVKTLKQIMKDLGHSDRIIDYLKIDVEYSEWDSIETMLKDGTLRHQVKQLGIEYHLPELNQGLYGRSTRLSLGREIAIFNTLEQHGFKLYFSHMNPTGGFFSSITRTDKHCCNEVYYINTNFK